jgi:hypothetical protein
MSDIDMVSDYFDGQENYVDADGVPVYGPGQNAEVGGEQQPTPEKVEAQEQPKSVQEQQTSDPLSFIKTGEDGQTQFDLDGAIGFAFTEDGKPKSVFDYQREPLQPAQIEQPPQVISQQVQGQQLSPDEVLKTNYFAGFNYVRQAIEAGYGPQQALEYAERQMNYDIDKYSTQQQMAKMREELTAQLESEKKLVAEQKEQVQVRPLAMQNIQELSQKYGGAERFKSIMYGQEYGGKVLQALYDKLGGGADIKDNEQYKQGLENFFYKTFSDKTLAGIMDVFATSLVRDKMWPQIREEVAKIKSAGVAGNRKTLVGSNPGKINNPSRQAPREPDAFDRHFGNISRVE